MRRFTIPAAMLCLVAGLGSLAKAQDDPKAILDKAIKAAGGAEKLGKIKMLSLKTKGKISFGGMESEMTTAMTYESPNNSRNEFEGSFGKGVSVIAGDKAWMKFGDMGMELDKDRLAVEKRNRYLQLLPITLVGLKDAAYKLAAAGTTKVDGKEAMGIKVTAPDGKDFTLYFDAKSGLPVHLKAKTVGFMGEDIDEERTFGGHKEMGGVMVPMKIVTKHNGEPFFDQEVTEFKALDKVDSKLFDEPK